MAFRPVSSLLVLGAISLGSSSRALVLFGQGLNDASYNTSATGTVAEPVFDRVGILTYPSSDPTGPTFTGMPIAPHYFITADHVRGRVGDVLMYQGSSYVMRELTRIGGSVGGQQVAATDLAVWRVDETFPSYTPLYTGSDEIGKQVVFVGAGFIKGTVETRDGTPTGTPIGWMNNLNGLGTRRWGTNLVDNTESGSFDGGATNASFLTTTFSKDGGGSEFSFAGGDSGGGGFINDNGVWKLAGVGYGTSGFYSRSATGNSAANPGFTGQYYDTRGLYIMSERPDGAGWYEYDYIDPLTHPDDVPSLSYLSRDFTLCGGDQQRRQRARTRKPCSHSASYFATSHPSAPSPLRSG